MVLRRARQSYLREVKVWFSLKAHLVYSDGQRKKPAEQATKTTLLHKAEYITTTFTQLHFG
ncbi:MAG: hypothetical protein AB1668_04665 [Nanoarchaeota archaeon]